MIIRRTKNVFKMAAFSAQTDYYQLFGIKQQYTQQQLKTAYLDLVKKYHPDLSRDPATNQIFKQVQIGYEILSNKLKNGSTNQQKINNSETTSNTPEEQSIIDQIRDKFYIKFQRKDQVNDQWNFSYNLFKKHYEKVQAPKADYQRYQGQGTSNNEYYASKQQKGESIWKVVIAAVSAGAVIGGAYLFTKA